MAKVYAGVVGAVLLAVGIIGFTTNSMMGLEFHMAHNIIHLATGVLGLWAALGRAEARRAPLPRCSALCTRW